MKPLSTLTDFKETCLQKAQITKAVNQREGFLVRVLVCKMQAILYNTGVWKECRGDVLGSKIQNVKVHMPMTM